MNNTIDARTDEIKKRLFASFTLARATKKRREEERKKEACVKSEGRLAN